MAGVSSASNDPFATLHAELNDSASDLLARTIQQLANAANDQPSGRPVASPEVLIDRFEQQYRLEQPTKPGSAVRRVGELRPELEPVLQSEGIPLEMISIVMVESGGRPDAVSAKGALGLWQLMPQTAIRYGLRVEPGIDERVDVTKSTHAAARYLGDLYRQFGSWPLALAAYNLGEERLQRAIQRAGTTNFLQLSRQKVLPLETRNYVPAVLSAMQMLGSGRLPEPPKSYSKTVSAERVFALPEAQP